MPDKRRSAPAAGGACVLTLCLGMALLGGCQSRVDLVANQSEPEPEPEPQVETVAPEEEDELIVYEPEGIQDEEQVAEAREIVSRLLDRAAMCDRIYRGALDYDTEMAPVEVESIGYVMVLEEGFETMEQVQSYFRGTFVMAEGGAAATRYANIQSAVQYMSINGELYRKQDASTQPLTMGSWNIGIFKLMKMEEDVIVVRMHTTLAGQDNDARELTLVQKDGVWLLDDSYFLDI